MTDKEKLLGRVRMYDFALVEVIEYLGQRCRTQILQRNAHGV